MPEGFVGFPSDAIDFFKDLAVNNNREWFQAHKDAYERVCREPMKNLMVELELPFGVSKISRINRDVRFSHDKSPYRTYIAAGIGGNYISLSAEGLYVGAGMYKPEPAALQRFRAAIDREESGQELQKIVTALRRKGYDVDTHEKVMSSPKGYPRDHPRIDLLRMKDIFAGKKFAPAAWFSSREALARIRRVMTDIQPLREWLRHNVGSRQ